MPNRTTPLIVTADRAQVHSLRLGEARILADGEQSAGAWWMGHFREDPGFATPLHVHPQMDEYIFVLSGVVSLFAGGGWHELAGGTLAAAPRGMAHAMANRGSQPAWILGWGSPAGFEGFFAAQAELLKRIAAADPELPVELARILRQHDTEVLGPPPEQG
jgi:quercetin dioxygenase-like cupin family protein